MTFGTMERIQTVTVGSGGAASIDFTNIPQTYDDLVIKYSLRNNSGVAAIRSVRLRVNANSSNIYSARILDGDGSGVGSGNNSSQSSITWGGWANDTNTTANTFSNCETYIPNYRSSSNKSLSMDAVAENNATLGQQRLLAGLIATTSAITQVTLEGEVNFVQHSTATLYGITRVPAGAKATGGVITDTDTHWIHTFTSSGVFTPTQNLSCDYLVVAGGGGGGMGGGGGGGYRTSTSFSVIGGTNYTVEIGGGGSGGTSPASNGSNGGNSTFSTITSNGGGGGGKGDTNGLNGGSGGGGGGNGGGTSTGGNGNTPSTSPSQGNNGGGNGGITVSNFPGGGGGGAGAAGGNATSGNVAGNGGNGSASSITGSSVTYAGGGGGSFGSVLAGLTPGTGGTGGGGNGASNANGFNATVNTGGGGGACPGSGGTFTGGAGGSGIVIVRYAK